MGGGLDFAELREYEPPDDIRHIDWNVTARMGTPFVRRYLEDREITAWFLVDLSPSMGFGGPERHKASVIVDLVGLLARLLTRNGNRVGAMLYDNNAAHVLPPRGGRRQVLRLINDIQNLEPASGGTMTDPDFATGIGVQHHQAPLAGHRYFGLYLPARLGARTGPTEPEARGAGCAALGPARDGPS